LRHFSYRSYWRCRHSR